MPCRLAGGRWKLALDFFLSGASVMALSRFSEGETFISVTRNAGTGHCPPYLQLLRVQLFKTRGRRGMKDSRGRWE